MKIKGATAVITGAAGGIGKAVAIELANRGARGLALVDQSETVQDLAKEINTRAGQTVAVGYSGDVTSQDFRTKVYAEAEAKFGRVGICVPAAGITRDRLAVKLDKETHKVT